MCKNVLIRWVDADPENEAYVDRYYTTHRTRTEGTLITGGIPLSLNGSGGSILWDVSNLANGTCHVFATIADRSNSRTVFAPGAIVIMRRARHCRLDEVVMRTGLYAIDFKGNAGGRRNLGLRLFSHGTVSSGPDGETYSV